MATPITKPIVPTPDSLTSNPKDSPLAIGPNQPVVKNTTTQNKVVLGMTGRMDYSTNPNGVRIAVDPTTGLDIPVTNSSNPIIDSSATTNTNNATGADIKGLIDAAALEKTAIENERLSREASKNATLEGINTEFDLAQKLQGETQGKEYAGRATGLVTAGGGFLGGTQSHEGVLANLQKTFDSEKTALLAKKFAAINAAKTAWEDKDFALARQLATDAKNLQQDIYNREKDFADQQLSIAKEARAKQEFDYGITDKKAASFAALPDAEYSKISQDEKVTIDKSYFSGYLDNLHTLEQKKQTIQTSKDQNALDIDILDMRLKMPLGKTFNLDGVTYTGLKKDTEASLTAGEKQDVQFAKVSEILSGKLNTTGTPLYTIPGSKGTPYLDKEGYLTPEGWTYSVKNFGVDSNELIKKYSHLFNSEYLDNYQISAAQKKLITGMTL